jgi:hypothetical protein
MIASCFASVDFRIAIVFQLMSVRPARGCWSVYDETGNVIETYEHAGEFKEP